MRHFWRQWLGKLLAGTTTQRGGGTRRARLVVERFEDRIVPAPIANNDVYSITERSLASDPALIVSSPGVLANDTDPLGNPLTASALTSPTHGSLVFNTNGSFVYTPNTGYLGSDSFTYEAQDAIANQNSTPATVTLNVTARLSIPTNLVGAAGSTVVVPVNMDSPGGPGTAGGVEGATLAIDYAPTVLSVSSITNGSLTSNTNAVQTISFGGLVTGGSFTLAFNSATGAAISYSTNPATLQSNIQAALDVLVGAGDTAVSASSATNVTVTLQGSTFGASSQPTMTVASANLTGTNATVAVATTTQGFPAWSLTDSVGTGANAGQIGIAMSGNAPDTNTLGGSLVLITFNILATAPGGPTPLNLAAENTPSGTTTVTTRLDSANGSIPLRPAVTNSPSDVGVDGILTVEAPHFSVTAPSTATAGHLLVFTVTALDAFNSVATAYAGTVHFSSTDSKAMLSSDATLTGGVGTFAADLETAGNQTLTATDTVTSTMAGTSNVIVVSAGATTQFVVAAPGSAIAGIPLQFTVLAEDQFGNLTVNYTGTVHFTNSAAAALPANTTLTAGAGVFSAILNTPGTQTISATDTANSALTGTSSTIIVGPAATTFLTVTGPSAATVGFPFLFTVTALNSNGSAATNYAGTVHFTSSDTSAVLPANATLSGGGGVFTATLKTAGQQTLTATDTLSAAITGTSSTITAVVPTATHFVVTAPSSATAGALFAFTVTALNSNGNTATNYAGTIHFSSSDAQALLPTADATLTAGVSIFSVTLKTAGQQTLTVTDTLTPAITGTSSTILVGAAAASRLSVTGPSSATAGVPFTFTVTAHDSYGNTATNYAGTVHFNSSDAQATLPANATLTGSSSTFTATLKTAGQQTLTATDTLTPAFTGTGSAILVGPAAAAHLTITAPSSATVGVPFTVSVTTQDSYGNPATTYAGTIHFTSSDALAVLPANPALTGGVGAFTVTLNTVGQQTLTAAGAGNAALNGTAAVSVAPTPYTSSPFVQSINRASPAGPFTAAASVAYTVTFSQAVTGVAAADFQLALSGTASATITQVTPVSASVYTVNVGGIAGTGTLGLNLVDNSNIRNQAGDPLIQQGAPVAFQALPTFAKAGTPESLVVADFNGDGKPDLAISAEALNNGSIELLLGNGNGTFQFQNPINTGSKSYSLAVGDFNGDGKPDLAVAYYNRNQVVLLLGNGNGTFQSKSVSVTGPSSLTVADVNGDSIPDLLVNGRVPTVLLGNGNATFQVAETFAAGQLGNPPTVADVNGDGKPDLIGTAPNPSYTGVMFGNGNGTFQSLTTFAATQIVTGQVAVADVNGDGKPDLIIPNDGPIPSVSVLFGNGNGTFQSQVTFATGTSPYCVAVADVNGDGKPDLVVGTSDRLSILLGNGNGTFQSPIVFPTLAHPESITVADLTGDGRPDLIVTGLNSSSVAVLLNSTNGNFTGQVYTVSPLTSTHLVVTAPNGGTAGTALTFTVTAQDGNGNTVTNYAGTVHFTSSDTRAVLPADATLTGGVGTFTATLKTAGQESLTAADTTTASLVDVSGFITVNAALANHFAIAAPVAVSVSSPFSVTVTVQDQFNNTVTGYQGTIHFTSSDPQALLPLDATLTNGIGGFSATLQTLNAQTLTVAEIGNPAITGTAAVNVYSSPLPWPFVESINRTAPAGPATNAASVEFTVTFSEPVTGVSPADFQLAVTGTMVGTVTQVTPVSGSVYTVTVAGISGAGTLGLNLVDNGTIRDLDGTGLTQSNFPLTFLSQTTYATGALPQSVALADFNGDGNADLVVANGNSDSVSVFLGNGNGTFQNQQTYFAGAFPISVATADLTGDGKSDIIVANYASNTVSVLLGNGNGTFQTQQTYPAGTKPKVIAVADVNGDGKPDIAVTNNGSSAVSVLLGNGNGTFQAPQTLASSPFTSVALADVNGDGRPDRVVAYPNQDAVGVLLGNGNGTFQAEQSFAIGLSPIEAIVGDLNGDGRPDIIALNQSTANVSVLLNAANGNFTGQFYTTATSAFADFSVTVPSTVIAGKPFTLTVTALDSNGNIAPSYAGTVHFSSSSAQAVLPVNVTLTNGLGFFLVTLNTPGQVTLTATDTGTPTVTGSVTLTVAPQYPVWPYVVSIDRTSPAGVFTGAGSATYTVTFSEPVTGVNPADFQLVLTGTVAATITQVTPVSGSVYTVTVSGISGGGLLGLNLVDNGSIHDLAGNPLTQNNSSVSFLAQTTFSIGTALRFSTLADVNGDGKADLIATNERPTGFVTVLLGNGNGTFQNQPTYATGSYPVSVAVADVNGDGIPDLVVANARSNNVSVLLGNGNGTFQNQITYPTGSYPDSVAVADVNGDGKPDLVVADGGSNDVSIFLGNGNGTFQTQTTFNTGTLPAFVADADLNGDGKLDLVFANWQSNSVSVLLGNGNGTFQTQLTFATGVVPSCVAIGDLNGDGKPDLVVSDAGTNTVSVLLGNGNGTFQSQMTYTTLAGPGSVAIADVNHDGKPDLVISGGSSGDYGVAVLVGNGNGTFQPQTTFAGPHGAGGLAIGDVNGDGKPDLAIASYLGQSVSVLLNAENGSFTGQVYTVTGGVATHFAVSTSATVTAGSPFAVTVTAEDFSGNIAATYTGIVHFTTTDNGAGVVLPQYYAFTAADGGVHVFSGIILATDGPQVITATDTTTGSITGSSGNIAVSSAPATHFAITAPTGAPAGVSFLFTVTALDQFNNTVSAYAGTVHFAISDNQAVPPPDATLTNGIGTFALTFETLGIQTLTALDANNSAVNGKATFIVNNSVTPWPYVESINRTSSSATVTSGASAAFTVVFSEPVTGVVSGDFTFAVTGSVAPGPVQVTPVSSSVYTVNVSSISGTGTLGLNLVDNDSIRNLVGDPLTQQNPTPSFQTQQTYATGPNPRSLAVADFNGDGKPDLATANEGSNGGVSVLLGNGNGTFQNQSVIDTSGNSYYLAAGDLNGDGKPDLAVANFGTYNSVGVLLGNGNGTFQNQTTYSFSSFATGVAVADLTGDSKLDLIVTGSIVTGPDVGVYLGNGNGTFQNELSFAAGGYSPVVADINGDGKPDLVLTNFGSATVSVLFGNGNGTFQNPVTFATGSHPVCVAVADINGDGKPDLIVANAGTSGSGASVSIMLGNGNGTFQNQTTMAMPAGASFVTVADLLGDGKPDLIIGNGNTISVLVGNGGGTFQSPITFAVGSGPSSIAAADVNGDGRLDLIVTNGSSRSVSVLLNSANGNFTGQVYTVAAPHFAFTGIPAAATAGSAFSFTLTTLDASNNVDAGYTGTVHFSKTDTAAGSVLAADYTFVLADGGIHVFTVGATLITAGLQTITASDNSSSSMTGSVMVTVNPAAASHFTVTAQTIVGPGSTFNVTVAAMDPFGNAATNYAGTIHFSSTDPTAVLPPNGMLTNGAGTFSATLHTPGMQTVTVTDTNTSTITGTSNAVEVLGPTTHFSVSAPPTATTGVPFIITVTALDAFNYMTPAYGGTVHITTSSAQAVLPANATLTNGVGLFTVNLERTGNQTVTAADLTANTLIGTSSAIAVGAVAAHFVLSGLPTTITAGTMAVVTVTALDAFNNVAISSNGAVNFTSTDGNAVLPINTTLTNGVGVAVVTFKTAGNQALNVVAPAQTVSFVNAPGSPFPLGSNLSDVAVGDFTGNGLPDLAITDFNKSTVTVFLSNGDGTFRVGGTYVIGPGPSTAAPETVLASDLTGNGKLDLVVVNYYATSVSVLLGNGNGTFQAPVSYSVYSLNPPTSVYAFDATVGDFTGDGILDLAVTGHDGAGGHGFVSILLGNGNGTFRPATDYLLSSGAQGVVAEDFNHDGKVDLAVQVGNVVSVFLGNGNGTFGAPINSVEGANDYRMVVGDFNGDGNWDLATVGGGASTLSLLLGNGNGTFQNPVNYGSAPNANQLAVADVNGDGKSDIIVGGAVFLGNGNGTFSTPQSPVTPSGVSATGAGDFNGDGSTDLVDLDGGAQAQVSIFLNQAVLGRATISVTPAVATHFEITTPPVTVVNVPFLITVTAEDAFNNTAPAYSGTVNFSSSSTAAVLPASATLVSGQGTFTVNVPMGGTVILTATDTVSASITGTSGTIPVSYPVNHFVLSAPSTIVAGNPITVTVTALDMNNAVTSAYAGTLRFTSSDAQAVLPSTTMLSGSGVSIFSATLETAGSQTLTVTDPLNNIITGNTIISVTPAALSHFLLTAPASVTPGNPFAVTVTAQDQYNNTVTGYGGTVKFTKSDKAAGSTVPSNYTFVAADQGIHVFTNAVTLVTVGNATLTVSDSSFTYDQGSATVLVAGGPAAHFTLTESVAESAGIPFTVTVVARDQNGNLATGYLGTVHFMLSDTATGAVVPADYTFVAADLGTHVFTYGVTFITSGIQTITVADTAMSNITATSSAITVFAGSATHLALTAPPAETAGVPFVVTVTARDAYNNIATGYDGTAYFASTDNQGAFPVLGALASGVGTLTVTLKTAGIQTVTAVDTVTPSIAGTSNALTVSAAAATRLAVNAPGNAVTGDALDFAVTARDAFGNTVTGYTGTVHFSTSAATATLPPDSTLTGGAGTFTATLDTIGNQTLTAADTATSAIAGTSAPIAVSGPVIHYALTGPPTATPGVAFRFTVTALDQLYNPAIGYTGTVHFISSDTSAVLPANATLTGGIGSFSATLKTGGSQTITAYDAATSIITGRSAPIAVSTAATHFQVAAPASTAAGSAFVFTVTALDAFGNVATSYAGTVHFVSSDGQATLGPNATLTNGIGVFAAVLRTAGSQKITATDIAANSLAGTSAAITVVALATSHFAVSAPASAITGSPLFFTVMAEDQFGNIASNYTGTVHFTSGDAAAALPGNTTLTAGSGIFSATLKTPGIQTISAIDTSAAITGTSNNIATVGLAVASLMPTSSGFVATFNKPFAPSVISLYGSSGTSGPDDVLLSGAGLMQTSIHGSLIIDPTDTTITFVKTSTFTNPINSFNPQTGVLSAGTYTVTFRSAVNGFTDLLGGLLDGSSGPASNYITTFVVSSTPAVVVGIPGFARGPDSAQAINLPNNQTDGIPINLSDGTNVTSGKFTLQYNSALLNITGASVNSALTGATLTLDASSTPGNAVIDFTSPTALPAGVDRLGGLVAFVPNSAAALYKSKALLHFSSVQLNGGAIAVMPDDAVEVDAYFGDANGDGQISGGDAGLISSLAAGMNNNPATGVIGGFAAYPLADPVLIADLTSSGNVNAADVTLINSFLAGTARSQIPAIPTGLTIVTTGPDPSLSLPSNLQATPGGTVTVPVDIDTAHPDGSSGMTEAILALRFDPAVFTVSPPDVALGTLPLTATPLPTSGERGGGEGNGWQLTAAVNSQTGEIGIDLFSTTPIQNTAAGSLVTITLHVRETAPLGSTGLELVTQVNPTGHLVYHTLVADPQGALVLHPALTAAGPEPGQPGQITVEQWAVSRGQTEHESAAVTAVARGYGLWGSGISQLFPGGAPTEPMVSLGIDAAMMELANAGQENDDRAAINASGTTMPNAPAGRTDGQSAPPLTWSGVPLLDERWIAANDVVSVDLLFSGVDLDWLTSR